MERASGIVMPVLGLKRPLFAIPKTWRLSVSLRDTLVLNMVDCSLSPEQMTKWTEQQVS